MKPETAKLLETLENMTWFIRVGEGSGVGRALQVFSWQHAIDACKSKQSRFVAMESKNILTQQLHAEFRERYRQWNPLIRELKKYTKPLVKQKTHQLTKENKLPSVFQECVHWDIMCAGMELEYGDVVAPRFFQERARWYLAGRWPCGWEGHFPEGGRLMVF